MPKISKELVSTLLETGKGMIKTQVTELADAGLSNLAKHFPNKEKLIHTLIEREADRHLEILEKKYSEIKDQPFDKIIEALVLEIAEAMNNGKVGIKIILTSTFAEERLEALLDARRSLVTFVNKVLKDAGYENDTRLKAFTIVAALGGMVETVVFRKDESYTNEQLAKETTKLVLAYCKS
jgi:AcrR family transcriptional regulator